MSKAYTGINIQYPISQDILSGEKSIETRTYPLPDKYIDVEMAMIETPGKKGDFKSRIVAIIKFTSCHKYKSKAEFYSDVDKHLVDKNSDWRWKDKAKYGWKVIVVKKLSRPKLVTKKKGIVYTKDITI